MEKKIYTKPIAIQYDLDKQMNMVLMSGVGGGVRPPKPGGGRNRAASDDSSSSNSGLDENPFGN